MAVMESVSDVCAELWRLDHNRFKEGEDYVINLKGKDSGEGAKLFAFMNAKKLTNSPTYKAFLQLLNNYESETSVREQETARKKNNVGEFLNRCLETEVMKEALRFLSSQKFVPTCIPKEAKRAFKEKLYELWFTLHPRPRGKGLPRSVFEHVFVGETRDGQVLGFHNWVRLYEEERQGNIIYKGYKPRTSDDRIITINFAWNGNKTSSKKGKTFFVGTSPEFELAIYTVCFLAGNKNETTVTLGNATATIITYHEKGQIGGCYPKLQEQTQIRQNQDSLISIESEENWTPDELWEDLMTYLPIQGQMPESQYSIIPIESEESSTPEEDQEIGDQPETVRLITPEENQFSSGNDEVRIPIAPKVDRARYLDERKPTRDYCCTIL